MNKKLFFCGLSVLLAGSLVSLHCAQDGMEQQTSSGPSVEGTYILTSRTLPDGTTQSAPDVMGLLSLTKEYRNFNVIWKDEEDKVFSYSLISKYKLTESEYSEEIIYSILNDQINNREIQYNFEGPSETVPVTIQNGSIQFNLPFDPVTVKFEGDKMIAESPEFTDTWEKVN